MFDRQHSTLGGAELRTKLGTWRKKAFAALRTCCLPNRHERSEDRVRRSRSADLAPPKTGEQERAVGVSNVSLA